MIEGIIDAIQSRDSLETTVIMIVTSMLSVASMIALAFILDLSLSTSRAD
jgi:hypothetical protein